MAKKNAVISPLVLLVFCILTSCKAPSSHLPEMSDSEVTGEQHKQQRMVDDIYAAGGKPKPWRNRKNMREQFEAVGQKVEEAGVKICKGLGLQYQRGCYYYFRMTRNEDVNAAADGENIYIYTGMMRFVESDDELATIMGHELAHNLMRHREAEKQNVDFGALLGMTADMIASSQGLDTDGGFSELGSDIGMLSYSVEFEQEADYVGLYIMALAGYDIKKAPLLWRRISIESPDGIYASTTHPSNAERFVALNKVIKEIEFKRKTKLPLLPDFKQESGLPQHGRQ